MDVFLVLMAASLAAVPPAFALRRVKVGAVAPAVH
jgi:hypothetical protein